MTTTTTETTCPGNKDNCTGQTASYGNGIADVWVLQPCGHIPAFKDDHSARETLKEAIKAYKSFTRKYRGSKAAQEIEDFFHGFHP